MKFITVTHRDMCSPSTTHINIDHIEAVEEVTAHYDECIASLIRTTDRTYGVQESAKIVFALIRAAEGSK